MNFELKSINGQCKNFYMASPNFKSIKIRDADYGVADEIQRERGVPLSTAIGAALRAFRKLPRKAQDAGIREAAVARHAHTEPSAA
jgi:hypothetical protein